MSEQEQAPSGRGFTRHVAKKALEPIVAAAATAATGYVIRKGAEIWQAKVLPKIEERGGSMAVATDALDSVREQLPVPPSEKPEALSSKVTSTESSTTSDASAVDADRAAERRKREQRRRQRRRAIERAGST